MIFIDMTHKNDSWLRLNDFPSEALEVQKLLNFHIIIKDMF